jgi:hypothetical protein
MSKLFNQIQLRRPKKSKFDLSHEVKTTIDFGKLYPVLCHDVLPGDSFRVNTEMLIRLQPLLSPVMHRINATLHYFYVPNRILWSEWENFITGGQDGLSAPIHPYVVINTSNRADYDKKTLAHYLGVPIPPLTLGVPENISALPFAAYQKIFNDYYRDSTLQAENFDILPSGDVTLSTGLIDLRYRNLERDYFTSCMPWAQRGPQVTIPTNPTGQSEVINSGNEAPSGGDLTAAMGLLQAGGIAARIETELGITIRDLRQSNRLQEWLEKNAVAGGRYIEQVLAHFGVHTGDARVQRAEYLGGGKQPIVFSEVLQTSGTAGAGGYTDTPLGEMGGHGISAGNNAGFKHTFKEHGFIIAILSVMPVNTYQQGLPKYFSRSDKLEYPWPEFAQIGEQEVKNKELYFSGVNGAGGDDEAFGYQSRYAEMKYIPGRVQGDFCDNLDFWHLGRKFTSTPALNEDFIKADVDKRIFAVEDPAEDSLLCNLYHNISAIRPLPYFGTPTL